MNNKYEYVLIIFLLFSFFTFSQVTLNFTHADGAIPTTQYSSQGITSITNGYWYSNSLELNNGLNPVIITFLGTQTTIKISIITYACASTVSAWTSSDATGTQVASQTLSSAGQFVLTDGSNTIKSIKITQVQDNIFNRYNSLVYDTTLPVELTSFTAQQSGKMVTLNWSTATEVKNYGFEVEKTSPRPSPFQGEGVPIDRDGRGWEKIGFVQGNGNSNSPKSYSFVDKTISAGRYSYRLKQIDFDGQFEYSSVVDVQVDAPLAFALKQNYPNPFNPNTIIGYQLPFASHVALKVYDILGNEVAVLVNGLQAAGDYDIPFNGEKLNSGIYFYKLQTSDGFTATKKLMLVK